MVSKKAKMRIMDKWLTKGKKLTRSESATLGHLHTKAFGKKISRDRYAKEYYSPFCTVCGKEISQEQHGICNKCYAKGA